MSIVKMKRLSVIAPVDSTRVVLRSLAKLGCVELEKCDANQLGCFGGQLHISEENTKAAAFLSETQNAIKLLKALPNQKKASLFSSLPEITESQLFNEKRLKMAKGAVGEINELGAKDALASSEQAKYSSQIAALTPWKDLDVALNFSGTEKAAFYMGTLPAATDTAELFERAAAEAPALLCEIISADNEQIYLTITVHREQEEDAIGILKAAGFVSASFLNVELTAQGQIKALEKEIASLSKAREKYAAKLASHLGELHNLEIACDALLQEQRRDELLSSSGRTEKTVFLTGWLPDAAGKTVTALLEQKGCAWSLEDPSEEDEPPVLMQNNSFIDPVVSVTEMYGVPEYRSIVDPNPTMYPFYVAFFGFIMADAGYGILMFVGCWLALKLMKPKSGLSRMLKLFMHCGVATFIAGALFGGWFADATTVFSETFLGKSITITPLWFNPLENPMKMLYFSLGLGVVHLCTGMALSAYRMIKQGNAAGAVFDVGSWYVLFIGIGLLAAGFGAGTYISIIGLLLLLFAGGRSKKGFGKITGGLGNIYGITGYLSDILSYSRIMALGLSGAVVGQVMNKIGTLAGGGVLGIILFVVMFLVGHTFNLAISLLGAYVHTSRLQYIEFFGKFFEGGGKLFAPLSNNTKYVNIIRED